MSNGKKSAKQFAQELMDAIATKSADPNSRMATVVGMLVAEGAVAGGAPEKPKAAKKGAAARVKEAVSGGE